MRYRQIHLDFHTNPTIPGIGSAFDPDRFGQAYKDAHVDSVTVFAKCHHGVSYHPTEVGRMHPGLDFDLLRGQIDALHKVGINAPVYLTATWDELAAFEHPEWRTVSPDGSLPMFRPEHGNGVGWAFLDFSTGYLDYLCAQTDEVMRNYPDADGIFMDIAFQLPSISSAARTKMDALGLDWTNEADREKFTALSADNFFTRIRDVVRKHNPRMPLFFNSGHIRRGFRRHYTDYYTHLEIESLPTAGWGYEHFPLSARYVDPLDLPFLGMTGKFHTHWGEVGGYKKPDALLYECAAMIAQGARCSIGDHLHPTGKIDGSTMKAIGHAYQWVAEREAWAENSTNRAEIALMSVQAARRSTLSGIPGRGADADDGAVRVLLEGKFTFDVVDPEADLSPYRLLILPDVIEVDADLRAKIEAYAEDGGKVLMTGRSGIDPEEGLLFDVGATWRGTSENSGGDFCLPIADLRSAFVNDPLFMYVPAEQVELTDGASLGEVFEPYLNRSPRQFSGHVNAPSRPAPTDYVAGSAKGNFTYFGFAIFTAYFDIGAVAMLEIAERLVARALGREKMIATSLPCAGRVTIRAQSAEKRDVIHLLHANPVARGTLRGAAIQPIQELVTLHDIAVAAETTGEVAGVRLVPSGEAVPFEASARRVSFTVPRLTGQQMIEIGYV